MEKQNLKEYQETRKEIVRVQDCITEYMKSFFGVGTAAVGLLWFLSRLTNAEQYNALEQKSKNIDNILLDHLALSYISVICSLIVLAFSHILFHKLNTHNRYAGYARALAYEKWKDSPPTLPKKLFLWEVCLHKFYEGDLFGNQNPLISASNQPRGKIARSKNFCKSLQCINNRYGEIFSFKLSKKIITERFMARAAVCVLGKLATGVSKLVQCAIGGYMTIRTISRRHHTKSWTYSYVISFGLFVVAMAFGILFSISAASYFIPWPDSAGAIYHFCTIGVLGSLVVTGWLGMFLRLFRLCSLFGDRTTDFYMYAFLVARSATLKHYDIEVDTKSYPKPPLIKADGILPNVKFG